MKRTLSLAIFSLLIAAGLAPSRVNAEKPNFVVIFCDDLGYGDLGCFGHPSIRTPHLDRMAVEGQRWTNFYVGASVCTPSRAALLTGRLPVRNGMMSARRRVLFPDSKGGLQKSEVTIAECLKAVGYATAAVGKWHLGHLPPCLPTYQGFEYYYGVPYSNDMWIDPANKLADDIVIRSGLTRADLEKGHKKRNWVPLFRGEEVIEYPADQNTLTKRYTEEAIRFINADKDKPFFLYLPHTMVHLPLAVSKAFAGRTGRLIWDAIEEVDWSVGEILGAVRKAGIADETLVIFTSDNGAAVGSSLPLRAKKGSVYDGGIREPTVMWWPGQIPAGKTCREVAATIDLLPTLAGLCGGKLPERKIDGLDIWPLMSGRAGAKSPHEFYVLMHGPGTVRSGKWKFYPWKEGRSGRRREKQPANPSPEPVQLYDTVADIGEKNNLAGANADLTRRLQAAYTAHVEEIKKNRRPTAAMPRKKNASSAQRPSQGKKKPNPKKNPKKKNAAAN